MYYILTNLSILEHKVIKAFSNINKLREIKGNTQNKFKMAMVLFFAHKLVKSIFTRI